MTLAKHLGSGSLELVRGDITLQQVDGFVFYAEPSLKLGSGYGGAIASRGGPEIQKELDELGPAEVTQVVVSKAGKLQAKHILHAVGPAFQEPAVLEKLHATIRSALAKAAELGLDSLALPAMGAGFYGVPLPDSARITLLAAREHLEETGKPSQLLVCLNDGREYDAFAQALESLS
jgi:O-acetyl-ADP-ribose deacetylase (regulator of RNase III)